jgi:phosphate transport system ATP-binding protein
MTSTSGSAGGDHGPGAEPSGPSPQGPTAHQASLASQVSFQAQPDPASVGVLDAAVIVARDVGVGFGAKTVLSHIELAFLPDTITALIGPTGCGKSTFLRSLNRMNDNVRGYWRTGTIELDGVEISGRGMDPLVLRRRVGMVFQRPNPFPMSIRDNVVAGVRAHRLAPRHELNDIAERFLKQVGLWSTVSDRLGDSPFRLSGGQQQLLCLARALAIGPDVLLLDEPTSSLDPVTTEMVEELLRTLGGELTIVIVTHNLAQAQRVADTTAFLYNGILVEAGDTQQIFEAPSEPETVSYVSGRIG